LIQKHFSPENILQETKKILFSEETRLKMISNFRRIKKILGSQKASLNAARELDKIIKAKRTAL